MKATRFTASCRFLFYILHNLANNLIRPLHWYLRGMLWVPIIWLVELGTGGLIRTITGTSPVIYRDGRQITGLIRLDMAPLWFVTGLLFEQIHDRLVVKYR